MVEYLKSYNNPLNHWDKLYKKATFSFIIYFTLSFFLISPVLIPQGTISNRGQVLPISEADASFTGEAKDAWAGMPINEAGDVNGDGFDDFIISALGNGQNNNYTGQIYLIFGDAFGWGLHINLSSSNASFHGETSYDFAGFSINGGGDINGDGLDDILIGAPENSEGANHGGQTYLILGKEEGWEKNISLLNSDASFIGNQDINLLGYQVTLNGDVNGDGYDDIIISEPLANYKSKAHLFLGKPSGWKMDTSSKDSDVVFINEEFYNSESTIQHVISGGDVNGDGFDDILITTRQRDLGENWDSARVYLFLGHRNNWKDTNLSDADASFLGDGIIDCVGSSIAFLGDVNEDGFDDIMIGAYNQSIENVNLYLFLGKKDGWKQGIQPSDADASFIGIWDSYELGGTGDVHGTSGIGDVNADGFDDFLFEGGYINNSESGRNSYLFLGKRNGWSLNTSVNDADISFSDLGDTVSTAGDVDGDGLPEVLIGAVSDDYSYPDAGQVFLFSPYAATPPSGVGSIALYSDDHYLTEAVDAHILDTIYVEATGTDTNSSRKDSMEVMVNSTSTAPIPIRITLYETDKNTGVYRGEFRIGYWSDKGRATIGAGEGERVWAWPRMDPSLEANLTILPAFPTIHPTDDIFIAHEDEAFSQGFYIEDSISTWDVKTGSDWLKWDDKNRTLLGIPDNADVGPHHVNMTARDRFGALDSENITIQVINRPPTILTNDTRNATQSIGYLVNYTCDDDGQGNITWHLLTNASFLSMNISTGVLSGVPGNDDVGTRFANVTVEDGNGGLDWSNFTLIVHNVNDGPIITTKDVLTINEDEELSVEYNARDVDENDVLEWRFETDATWLSFNQSTHVLSGMPRNDDVGRYYVNISVKDASNATDIHNFTLEVLNVPPKILTLDVLEVLEDQAYSVNYTCDDDGQGTVAWHMATNASWLSMNGTTGVLAGTPENDDVGSWWVNVSVDDGNGGFDWSNFSLRVINSNDIPIIITILILEATVDMLYIYDVNATDIDMGDVLRYILVTSPDGMTIDKDTGVIIWIPMQGQEGAQNVILEVTDSIASARQNFTINVYAHLIADITYPGPGEKVHGTIIVTGTATGPMGIWVEVNIDDTGWKRAIGSSSWTCEMDTEELDNGEHRIVARVILNEQSSDEVSVSFVVDNQEGGDILLKEGAVLWVIISFIIILLLFVIGSFIWRKNTLQMIDEADQDEEEEEEEEDEEEEDEEADEDEDEEEDDEEEEEEDDEEDEEKENEDDKDEEEEEDLPKKPKRRND